MNDNSLGIAIAQVKSEALSPDLGEGSIITENKRDT